MSKIKKLSIILIFLAMFILLGTIESNAAGNLYLNNLNFTAQINEDGSMDVIETWDISIENTNTLFKTFETDESKYTSIHNVEVIDITYGNYKVFTQIDELMYHVTKDCYYGLRNDNGDFEIAWGVGLDNTSANRVYQISYTVEDAIAKYTDYAELYWQFIGNDFEISSKNITGMIILPDYADTLDEIKVWGHTEGLNGEIYATDLDLIEFELTDFVAGRYVEIRTLFPTSMIISSGREYSTERLEEVIEEETIWANEANARRQKAENAKKIITVGFIISCLGIGVFSIRSTIKKYKEQSQITEMKPTIDLEYYREIPRKNVTPAQALYIYRNSTADFNSKEMGKIFSATILNLSLKKYIEFEYGLDKDKEITIKIKNTEIDQLEDTEKEILKYIISAASDKKEITVKELQKYMKEKYTELLNAKTKIDQSTTDELEKNGIYDKKEAEKKKKLNYSRYTSIATNILICIFLIFVIGYYVPGSILCIGILGLIVVFIIKGKVIQKHYKKLTIFTQKGIDEQQMWKGLKKYMEDFSLLDRREVPEIAIWEEFLVYATVFGIAEKVLKQLKIVYSEMGINIETGDYGYMYLMMNTDFSSSFENSINSAVSSAYSSAYSSTYSSGSGFGGGFSGGGGGGRRPEEAAEADKIHNTDKNLINKVCKKVEKNTNNIYN